MRCDYSHSHFLAAPVVPIVDATAPTAFICVSFRMGNQLTLTAEELAEAKANSTCTIPE
jgi:hypothetical protein